MEAVVASFLPVLVNDSDRDRDRDRDESPHRSHDINADFDGRRNADHQSVTLDELYNKLKAERNRTIKGFRGEDQRTDLNGTILTDREGRKRIVEMRVSYLKISQVDTPKQKFHADVFIQAKWEEPSLDGKSVKELENFSIDDLWTPQIYVTNIFGIADREETWYTAEEKFEHHTHPVIIMKKRIKGVFNERLELTDFPLDVQDLQLQVASHLTQDQAELIEDQSRVSTVNKYTFVDQSEWSLYDHVDSCAGIIPNKLPMAKYHHPCISFSCSVRRNPTFYFWNVFFLMLLICGMLFTTFGIPHVNYEERLKITLLLLLSCVAMKYVSLNAIPKGLSYLTSMDIYILMCIIVVTVVAVQNAVLSVFAKEDVTGRQQFDNVSFYIILIIFLFLQLTAVITALVVSCRRRHEMRGRDKEYHAQRKAFQQKASTKRPRLKSDFAIALSEFPRPGTDV